MAGANKPSGSKDSKKGKKDKGNKLGRLGGGYRATISVRVFIVASGLQRGDIKADLIRAAFVCSTVNGAPAFILFVAENL